MPDARAYLRAHMTAREAEVLDLVVCGATNRAIAAALGISAQTVKNHLAEVLRAAGVSTRTELACLYYGAVPYSQRPGGPDDTESHA